MQTHRRRPSKSILLPRTLATAPHHHSTYARRMTIHLPESVPDNTHLWGYALLCATFFVFVATMYAMVGSKYAPQTNIEWLDWIKNDTYYCLLVPITAIAWIYFIVWNWMGMKFFRHN